MEENVALDSNKQKQFVKSIKGIKKLIKKNEKAPKPPAATQHKPEIVAKDKKRKVKERGLVYLSHIPHGFYENEMTQYFKQFGRVTNVRVIRSKRTGNSRGCAFVEFSEPAVAQIVADTMNNYLMGKRLIKAALVPLEKQRRHVLRKNWNQQNNPGNESRLKLKRTFNAKKTNEEDLRRARNILKNLDKSKKRLKEMGIDYDFFTPVDIPEELLTEPERKPASDSMKSKQTVKNNEVVVKKEKAKKRDSKLSNVTAEKSVKAIKETSKLAKKNTRPQIDAKTVQQGKKQQKIKDAGMKLPENFIKITQSASDDGSDDGSMEFDSDEFEKEQDFNEEFDSDAEESGSDGDGSNDEEDDEESSEDESPTPKKGPFKPKLVPKAGKHKPAVLAPPSKQVQKAKPSRPQPVQKNTPRNKRKAPKKPEVNLKKQKFEKKVNQQAKIFKKK